MQSLHTAARRFALALLAMTGLAVPRLASACSICLAGDPLYSTQGASAQAEGDLALFVQLQSFEKTAGALEHAEHAEHDDPTAVPDAEELESADDQRLDLFLSWTPVDRLTATANLPFSFNEIREGGETLRASGVGDMSLSVSAVAWRDRPVLPSAWLELRAFVKAPTGDSDRARGGAVDPHLQPGTGSWDFGAGIAGAKRFASGALYGSAFYRENRSGDFGHDRYAFGDVVLITAALEVPVGHALQRASLDGVTLGAEVDFRYATHDRLNGARFEHSGGSVLYATPSVRIRLPFRLRERPASLRGAVQIPLTSAWLNGFQREDEVWSIGLYLPL